MDWRGPYVNMAAVQRRKSTMVEELRKMHLDHTKASGADLIMGVARFVGPRTVEIELRDGGTRTVSGDRLFLDLGSRAAIPELPGLTEAKPMTHVEALDLDCLPKHLIVLGGGYVGLELSQAFRRFGSEVTVLEEGPQLASREDPDIGAALKDLFVDEGIKVALNAKVRRVEGHSGNNVQVYFNAERGDLTIEGSDLLVATGRKANTDAIGLDKAGIQLDAHGYIKVNDRLETTVENVWAMGDCADSPQFTHVGSDDFSIVPRTLAVATAQRAIASSLSACSPTPSWRESGRMRSRRVATASSIGWRKYRWPKCFARKQSASRAA